MMTVDTEKKAEEEKKTKEELKEEVKAEVREQVKAEVTAEVKDEIKEQVKAELKAEEEAEAERIRLEEEEAERLRQEEQKAAIDKCLAEQAKKSSYTPSYKNQKFSSDKLIIWDAHRSKIFSELRFFSEILKVKIKIDRIIVTTIVVLRKVQKKNL